MYLVVLAGANSLSGLVALCGSSQMSEPALTDGPKAAITCEDIPEFVHLLAIELKKIGSTLPSHEDPTEGVSKTSGKSQLLPSPPPPDLPCSL